MHLRNRNYYDDDDRSDCRIRIECRSTNEKRKNDLVRSISSFCLLHPILTDDWWPVGWLSSSSFEREAYVLGRFVKTCTLAMGHMKGKELSGRPEGAGPNQLMDEAVSGPELGFGPSALSPG